MSEINYEIIKKIGVFSKPALSRVEGSVSVWSKEVNLISWNDRDPKYDIRASSPKFSSIEFGGGQGGGGQRITRRWGRA